MIHTNYSLRSPLRYKTKEIQIQNEELTTLKIHITHHSKNTYHSPLYLEIQSYANKFTTYKGDTKLDRLPKDQVKDFSIHIFPKDQNI